MSDSQRLAYLRGGLGLFSVLIAGTAYRYTLYLQELGVVFSLGLRSWWIVLGIVFLSAAALLLLVLSWTGFKRPLLKATQKVSTVLMGSKVSGGIILILALLGYPWIIFSPIGFTLTQPAPRFLIFTLAVVGVVIGLKSFWPSKPFSLMLASSVLMVAFIHQCGATLVVVSDHPFSLGWSEVSRYYYASLFFSERLYGFEIPPSVLHPTRYLMQSVPFLIDDLPLWAHRLWQALLWLSITLLTGGFLVRRISISDRQRRWMLIGWIFLFLLVGPVYYHLQVVALIVLASFNREKLWRSFIFILLASAWAGISRVNWYPVPGMVAAILYFIEKVVSSHDHQNDQPLAQRFKTGIHYLSGPICWVVAGTLTAFGSQALYIYWSGNDPGQFTSSFTSDLLWYRLWPNSTYPLGILPGVLLFSLPFWVLLFLYWQRGKGFGHQLRWIGISAILLVLFVGGLVVSVKIGGGSNLHNMDAYLTVMAVVCVYLYGNGFAWETRARSKPVRVSDWLTTIMLLIPVIYLVPIGEPLKLPDQKYVEATLSELTTTVTDAVSAGGEVLFVTQRHLVTFDIIPEVPLVPDYEVVFLMEMAMGNNQDYLGQFYTDIENHRFDLIIIDWLPESQKTMDESFSEEHNAWFLRVAKPLKENYTRLKLYNNLGIEVVIPKQ